MMDASVVLAVVLGAVVVLLVSSVVRNRVRQPRPGSSAIPRGSSGWPLIGETLDFANVHPLDFTNPRVKKYGPVFKSHLLGVPSIVVTAPDVARFVYSERSLFRGSYPSNITTLVGKKSLSSCDPARHPVLKRSVQSALLPDTLRRQLGRLEGYVLQTLDSWDGREIKIVDELKEYTLSMAVFFIFGIPDIRGSAEARILVDAYREMSRAFFALPINIPGCTWYKALKKKRRASDYLSSLIAKSRKDAEEGTPCDSVLRSMVVTKDENGNKLGDDEIIDVLTGTLFGGHDTTATSITWIIKFLSENPNILEAVVAEQEEILRSKAPGEALTWEDTRKMHYTQMVCQETLRYPTVLQFTGRAATQDVEHKGYLFPKGWRVFVMTTSIHLDPANFPSPTTFDPSRFKVAPRPGTYLPFAGGTHICPGNELAKLNMLVFIHHLTTKFRWESLQPDQGIEFNPFPLPKGGFPIKVHRKEKS